MVIAENNNFTRNVNMTFLNGFTQFELMRDKNTNTVITFL